ncbi:transglutaminase domain-containing protein [Metamycoplasma canadense]|uniref:transglutaminase domain-containing protein n=1 Tax=Metamycoplasma canadense TaxID=29554 RepID=UPI0005ED698E|nr:transglutaminase domain-containing protein [Metamycoplasma canadense]
MSKNVVYKERDDLVSDQPACSSLIEKVCVCAGYAKGYKMLLDELNIPSRFITRIYYKEYYLWNLVEIEGEWYHVDSGIELTKENIWIENAFFKRYLKSNNSYLIYLTNFDSFGNYKVKLSVFKKGYFFYLNNRNDNNFEFEFDRISSSKVVLKNLDLDMEYRINLEP